MGFLDKIREVAEEMERLAATEEAARLERMNQELLRQMELTGLDQPGQGAMSSGWQPQGHPPGAPEPLRRRSRTPRPSTAPAQPRTAPRPPAQPPAQPATAPQGLRPPSGFALTASDLPRAMILKEILGPPPGLSDEPW